MAEEVPEVCEAAEDLGPPRYTDTNGAKTWNKSTTKAFLAAVNGQVWLTEVGGIVAFNYKYGYDEHRAAGAPSAP